MDFGGFGEIAIDVCFTDIFFDRKHDQMGGIDNLRLGIQADAITGTLAMRFRWDEARGNGIQVSVSKDAVVVEEKQNGQGRVVTRLALPSSERINVSVLLVGNRIAVVRNDQATPEIPPLQFAGQGGGVTEMYLYDRVRDVARVENVQLYFEPLSSDAVAWPPTL